MTDRLENETAKAFSAFVEYAQMGEGNRSIRAVAGKLLKSSTIIGRWSRRHQWQKRVALWDKKQAELIYAAQEKALKAEAGKWAKRQISIREERYQMGQSLELKAKEMLAFPMVERKRNRGKTIIKPAKWTMSDAARLADTGMKLKALSAGVATDKTETSGPDNAPLVTGQPVVIILEPNERDVPQK
jgi:hypothetical protein